MVKREFWKVYDSGGEWVAICKDENVARHVQVAFPGGFQLKVLMDQETWEGLARGFLS